MADTVADPTSDASYGYGGDLSRNESPASSAPPSARGGGGAASEDLHRSDGVNGRPSFVFRRQFTSGVRRPSARHVLFGDDEEEVDDEATGAQYPKGIFIDAAAMKETVRRNLMREPYDVSKYYHKAGLWRDIATSPLLEKITMVVIALNAIWIGVETDYNGAQVLIEALPEFQVAEHFFCVFYSFEWFSRFMAFKQKRKGLRDGWFVFDSLLVLMMVMETWVFTSLMFMTGASNSEEGLGNASILRMARLARLSRMARMARLLKAMPELMILIKGIATATRSVFFTLCLLCLLLYIFGIAFAQLLAGTDLGNERFRTVPMSMLVLLCSGTFLDGFGEVLAVLSEAAPYYGALYMLFVLLATVTVLNMLIGVLCEVVSTVALVEKETMIVKFVKQRLLKVLEELDEDGNGTISKEEFLKLLDSREACEALDECGVDVEGIYDFADFIFQDDDNAERELTFVEFMEIMLTFRGTNSATVKDIADLTKFVKKCVFQSNADLKKLRQLVASTMHVYESMLVPRADDRALAQCASPSDDGDDDGGFDDDDLEHLNKSLARLRGQPADERSTFLGECSAALPPPQTACDDFEQLRKSLARLKGQLADEHSASLGDCSATLPPPQEGCDGALLADELLNRGLKALALLKDVPEFAMVTEPSAWTCPLAETEAPQEDTQDAASLLFLAPEPGVLPFPRLLAHQLCSSQLGTAAGDIAGGWPIEKALSGAGLPHGRPGSQHVPPVPLH